MAPPSEPSAEFLDAIYPDVGLNPPLVDGILWVDRPRPMVPGAVAAAAVCQRPPTPDLWLALHWKQLWIFYAGHWRRVPSTLAVLCPSPSSAHCWDSLSGGLSTSLSPAVSVSLLSDQDRSDMVEELATSFVGDRLSTLQTPHPLSLFLKSHLLLALMPWLQFNPRTPLLPRPLPMSSPLYLLGGRCGALCCSERRRGLQRQRDDSPCHGWHTLQFVSRTGRPCRPRKGPLRFEFVFGFLFSDSFGASFVPRSLLR